MSRQLIEQIEKGLAEQRVRNRDAAAQLAQIQARFDDLRRSVIELRQLMTSGNVQKHANVVTRNGISVDLAEPPNPAQFVERLDDVVKAGTEAHEGADRERCIDQGTRAVDAAADLIKLQQSGGVGFSTMKRMER